MFFRQLKEKSSKVDDLERYRELLSQLIKAYARKATFAFAMQEEMLLKMAREPLS